jgi:hypothetical protein
MLPETTTASLIQGETADVILTTFNNGHSTSPSAAGLLTSTNPYVTINSGASAIGVLNVSGNYVSTLNVTLSSNITLGTSFDLTFTVNAGAYNANKTFMLSAGEILEDFETNNFQKFDWYFGGNANWTTTSNLPFQGLFCARSGVIGNNATSELLLDADVLANDSISFFKKVSSEDGYDYLHFSIDGVQKGSWSGTEAWSYSAYPVSMGAHTFQWAYEKDTVRLGRL